MSARHAAAEVTYEAVIGIEIHVQLRTASKMFCGCSNDIGDAAPNANTCPVCLGLPGALPVINREAVRHVLATGIAIEATTPEVTRWDRKNYFYPDLPKGYQISQYELPLASHGRLLVETSHGPVEVGITRAHLEEDTARLQHTRLERRPVSLLDYDRSGAPLLEIVTDPVIHDAETARRYAEELRLLLVTIGASYAAMESGQMRVEANVSLRPAGSEAFGTRVEVKNMNSFRSVERAIEFEIARQEAALRAGEPLIQETRGWDDDRGRDLSHAHQGDLGRLPLLPRARPAAAARRSGLARGDPARVCRSCRRRVGRAIARIWASPPTMPTCSSADAAATAVFEAARTADPELPPKKLANWVSGEYLRLAKGEDDGCRRRAHQR